MNGPSWSPLRTSRYLKPTQTSHHRHGVYTGAGRYRVPLPAAEMRARHHSDGSPPSRTSILGEWTQTRPRSASKPTGL